MADDVTHLSQAKHNEDLANKLVSKKPFHDWGITAAFYASIHYFEYYLFKTQKKHTETDIPSNRNGENRCTPHAWREKLAFKMLSRPAFISFRDLKDASETARYLSLCRDPAMWTDSPASEHFKLQDAKDLVEKDLLEVKKDLKIK